MNKKLVPERVVEAELIIEAEQVEKIDDVAATTSSIQSVKRKGVVHKSFAKKKRKTGEESSSKPKGDEFKNDHTPPEHLREQLKVLTMIGKREEPEVVDAAPIGVKYPITKVTTGYHTNVGTFHDVMRTDGKTHRFIRFKQMLYYFDREDVEDLWKLYKEKFGAKKFDGQKYETNELDYRQTMADNVLWRALKLMFEPSMDDSEWTEIAKYKVKRWRLFQDSGIHVLEIGPHTLYMLADKEYPVVRYWNVVNQMVNGAGILKLQKDYDTDDQAFNLQIKI